MDDIPHNQSSPLTTKPCAMCGEPIRINAKKCVHCGSYQSWRGRINFSATILSLLVALTAVIGSTVPAIKAFLVPSVATFRFSPPTFNLGSVSVTATNIGAQPATLDSAFIMIPQKTGGQPYIFDLPSPNKASEQTVGPGETKILTYNFDHKRYDAPHVTSKDRPCFLDLYASEIEVSCDEIRYLVQWPHPVDRRGLLPEEGPEPLPHPAHWQ